MGAAMNFRNWSKVVVVRAIQSVRRRRCALRLGLFLICWLGFLTVGTVPAEAPPNDSTEPSLFTQTPELDDYQQAQIKQLARENTERFRIRVALPAAVFGGPPAGSSNGPARDIDAPPDLRPEETASVVLRFLGILLGFAACALIARKIAPEFVDSITGTLSSRALAPTASTDRLLTLFAEENAVSEFKAALSAGINAPLAIAAGESALNGPAQERRFSAAAACVREIRKLLHEAGRSVAPASQRKLLLEALERFRPLKDLTRPAELLPLRQVGCAVEMLLKQLTEKASNFTSSTLRTTGLGVALMEDLCQPGLKPDLLSEPPLRMLVVDDETFSRFALSHALKRGINEPDVAESGELALALVARRPYDLIILDVQMPGMDGFELCSKIHETAHNRSTPVVFVTSLRDFDARAKSLLCGGRDLIAKPFLTFELTVKALTLVAGERLRGRGRMADAIAEELTAGASTAPQPEPAKPLAAEGAAAPQPEATRSVEPRPSTALPVAAPGDGGAVPRPESAAAYFANARAQIATIRDLVERIRKTAEQATQQKMITDLFLGVHLLATSAEGSRQHSIAMMAAALEALLKKLLEKPANLSTSTLQAIETAAGLIQDLCTREPGPDLATAPPIRALVVDDDPVALRATTNALQMRFPKPESASDGKSAVALAAEKPFDVIFLDVQMPDIDGFEVCTRIRETSANRLTPIVFLTSHHEAAMRAKSESCGGNDFLTKPYLASEITLKALAFALRGRLQNAGDTVVQSAN
jgi:PleD family two-component response regulator